MAPERQLETAPHAGAADRGDRGFGARLDHPDQRVQRGLRPCARQAEFADVGAAGEELLSAGDDDRLHSAFAERAIDAGTERRSRVEIETVDGRMVERDDGHVLVYSVVSGHTSSHSFRTAPFARSASGGPSNTMRPCPIT